MTSIKSRKSLTRRDAMKVLAAAGAGLATATLLPGKWDKPVMQVGVLPAHAQSSKVTYYTIVDSSETFYWTQQEDYLVDLTVYIDPPDSGVAMKATYWIEEQLGQDKAADYGAPVSVTPVNTTAGTSAFAPNEMVFYWARFKVTYEFVNPAQCITGCSWTVEHINTPN